MKEIDLPDGSVGEFPDTMPNDQIQAVLRKQFGGAQAPAATRAAMPTMPAPTVKAPWGLPNIPTPMDALAKVLPTAMSPVKKAFDVAGQADVRAGIKSPETAASRSQAYTNMMPPLLAGVLTGGASLPVQAATQMGTTSLMQNAGMEPKKPIGQTGLDTSVLISGALPYAAAGMGRLARGLGRTATRLLPGRFDAAQQAAQGAAGDVVESLRPETAAGNLFKGARAAGAEVIPAGNIQRTIADIGDSIGENPKNPGLQLVKAYADDLAQATANGTVDLKKLMQMRLDLGRSLGKAPELKGLYGAILSDLEGAAAAGGPGANMATSALQAFKADMGANTFARMVESATKDSVAGGRALNIARLRDAVAKHSDELTRLLGPEKLSLITNFVDKYRALPPAMAYTAANILVNGLGGVAGAVAGGPLGALGSAVGLETLKNAALVGKNPPGLNAALGTVANMGRAALAPKEP